MNNNGDALKIYQKFKDKYPKSNEARDIEKDIARNKVILQK